MGLQDSTFYLSIPIRKRIREKELIVIERMKVKDAWVKTCGTRLFYRKVLDSWFHRLTPESNIKFF